MFQFMFVLSALLRSLKYIFGVPVVFALLGLPIAWMLIQRFRIKSHASRNGWRYTLPLSSSKSAVMKKTIDGHEVEVWPNDSFGAKVFVYFRQRRKLDMAPGRASARPKKISDFKTPSPKFNFMFRTIRAGKTEIEALQNDPQALQALLDYKARWMFSSGDMVITESYVLLYMSYGTPLGYFLPPRVLSSLSRDAVAATDRFEAAFNS